MIAVAAGLALADAAVVTLALPPILLELDTSVEGVAAVIAVYTAVLALALPVTAAFHGRHTGAAGALLFCCASLGCSAADSLELLLFMRALQALGAAALLAAAFDALDGAGRGRRLWLGAAVAGTAAGPALGGLLTELFDWRAIFIAQAPVALAAAPFLAALPETPLPEREAARRPLAHHLLAGLALALLSGALTAVVFLLVLLLISGWSVEPLAAAAAVSVLPVAAVLGSRLGGPSRTRAAAGSLLVAGGIGCLALMPEASPWWTLPPQALAGLGMGMAFPALAGELLPERTRAQAAGLLSLRHAGITLVLVVLAPVVSAELDRQVDLARERGTALVLDAALPPTDKVVLAPRLFAELETEDPRDALTAAIARERRRIGRGDRDLLSRLEQLDRGGGLLSDLEELEDRYGGGLLDELEEKLGGTPPVAELRRELDALADELDEVVLAAVDAAFRPAFAITGAMALLAALLLLPWPRPGTVAAAAGVAAALCLAYGLARTQLAPEPVEIANPCEERDRSSVGGLEGAAEDVALDALDRAACRFGSSREELVLALFDDQSRRAYELERGVNPRELNELLRGVLGL